MFLHRFVEEIDMTEQAPRASGQCHCGAIRYSMPTAVVIPRIPGEGRELFAKIGYAY